MTIEEYNRAKEIIGKIDSLNNNIIELKGILQNDTACWYMEVRPSKSFSARVINHYGLLPEFLQAVLSKQLAEYNALKKELEQI